MTPFVSELLRVKPSCIRGLMFVFFSSATTTDRADIMRLGLLLLPTALAAPLSPQSTADAAPSPRYPGEVFVEPQPHCPAFDAVRRSLIDVDRQLNGARDLYKRAFAMENHDRGLRDVLRSTKEAKRVLKESLEMIEDAERRLMELENKSKTEKTGG